jgi:hypothetical protein
MAMRISTNNEVEDLSFSEGLSILKDKKFIKPQ